MKHFCESFNNVQDKLIDFATKCLEIEKRVFAIPLSCGIYDKLSVLSIAYALFVMVLLAYILVWELYAKTIILYPSSFGTVIAVDVIARVTSFVSVAVCIVCSTFAYRKQRLLFLCKTEEIDTCLRAKLKYSAKAVEFLYIFAFLRGYIAIEFAYEYTLVARKFGHYSAIVNSVKIIYLYILATQVMDIVFWSISIRKRAASLNFKLADLASYWRIKKGFSGVKTIEALARPSLEIYYFTLNYNKLYDIIDLFQNIYGYQILVIILSVIAVIVKIFHTGLMLALDTRLDHWLKFLLIVIGGNAYNASIYIVSFLFCIFYPLLVSLCNFFAMVILYYEIYILSLSIPHSSLFYFIIFYRISRNKLETFTNF